MSNFRLFHTTLYAKNWYKRFNPKGKRKTMWDDLRHTFTADDYSGEFMTKTDMVNVMLINMEYLNLQSMELKRVLEGIHPRNCWQYGYYTNSHPWVKGFQNLEPYDMETAIMMYCLSTLRLVENVKIGHLPAPDPKVLPIKRGISEKTIKKHFKKREKIISA